MNTTLYFEIFTVSCISLPHIETQACARTIDATNGTVEIFGQPVEHLLVLDRIGLQDVRRDMPNVWTQSVIGRVVTFLFIQGLPLLVRQLVRDAKVVVKLLSP
jgi:hypothetical protein